MRDLVVITNDKGDSAICCMDSWNQNLPAQVQIWKEGSFVFIEGFGEVMGKCDESCFIPLLNSKQIFFATLRADGLESDRLVKVQAKNS